MEKRNTTFYIKNITPIDFCEKTIMWQLDCNGAYKTPIKTNPTKGEHDYNTCSKCQKIRAELIKRLSERFNGTHIKQGKPFPFCCKAHSNLMKIKEFDKVHFTLVPEMVADKIIYTHQHIINNHRKEKYYKDITDYIDYTVESFGQMPNDCGAPLYLHEYFFYVTDLLIQNTKIIKERKNRLLKFLEAYQISPTKNKNTDLNILLDTYHKWLNIFPFDISFFAELKPHFEKHLPILNGKPEYNPYSKTSKAKIHTKGSLIDVLLNLTDEILKQINPYILFEKGLLTNTEKIKTELILKEMRIDNEKGYRSQKQNEDQRYRDILKNWFNRQKKFIDEITPMLKSLPPQPININESRTKKVIVEALINIDKKGWQYSFVSEHDYIFFTDLLTNFFEYKSYSLPEKTIQLKRTCKTKLAKALGDIHKELSNENKLIADEKFFKLIRVLSHFEKETKDDLYKALTR